MSQLGTISWQVAGDVGGEGVSRFRFCRQDSGTITGPDCDAVAAASHALLNSAAGYMPSSITWSCSPIVDIADHITGLVAPGMPITTLPSPVVGLGSSGHGAGLGARINWHTDTISGRRLIKGATFLVPFTQTAFGSDGSVPPAVTADVTSHAMAYLAACAAANISPMIWHRPPKGTHTGGLTGVIFAGQCSGTPAGLRSRRS